MLRLILGAIIGVVAWVALVGIVSYLVRAVAPDVNAAMVAHTTVVAMGERLAISFLASLVGGYLAMLVARDSRGPLIAGVLMLAIFVPYHLFGRDAGGPIWTSFPLWYHLTFFVSLLLLSVLGGRLVRR
jgi:hypothetical protein